MRISFLSESWWQNKRFKLTHAHTHTLSYMQWKTESWSVVLSGLQTHVWLFGFVSCCNSRPGRCRWGDNSLLSGLACYHRVNQSAVRGGNLVWRSHTLCTAPCNSCCGWHLLTFWHMCTRRYTQECRGRGHVLGMMTTCTACMKRHQRVTDDLQQHQYIIKNWK